MCQIPWEAVTAIGTVVLVAATFSLIFIAWRGLADWRKTLRNDRIDNTVSAGRDLEGELSRVINAKANDWGFSTMLHLWDAHRRFDRAFYVLRRYHDLSPNLSDDVAEQLHQLGALFNPKGEDWWDRASQIRREVENLLKPIYEIPIRGRQRSERAARLRRGRGK